jgi:hypothetical protein
VAALALAVGTVMLIVPVGYPETSLTFTTANDGA